MDAKRWSKEYRRMLEVQFEGVVVLHTDAKGVTICSIAGSMVTPGIGRAPTDAYVDFVEEYEALLKELK